MIKFRYHFDRQGVHWVLCWQTYTLSHFVSFFFNKESIFTRSIPFMNQPCFSMKIKVERKHVLEK